MKQEELKVKNLNALEDETLKYIFVTIIEGKDFATSRNQLATELGMSKRMVSSKFREASRIVNDKIAENRKIELEKHYKKCNKNGFLELSEIAKYHNIDQEELKDIFTDYVDSFTDEEDKLAEQFGWSLEALKKGNVQTLKFRVNGFSNQPKYADQVFYNHVKEQDIQFLKSVSNICENYRRNNKVKKIS